MSGFSIRDPQGRDRHLWETVGRALDEDERGESER